MITVLGNRVIAKKIESSNKLSSGLYIPDASREETLQAEIVGVGPGVYNDMGIRIKPDVSVGDIVLHKKYAGDEFRIDGVDYSIIPVDDILAVV